LAAGLVFPPGIAASASLPPAAPLPDAGREAIEALLEGRVASGGFVAVARGAELTGFHAWGHASRPFRQPVTERTLFHFGSAGKQITAVAVLRLQAEGRVDLARPLGTYL